MQPNKFNIAIIGNNKQWIDAIGEKLMTEVNITESHALTKANILNSTLQANSYVYGPQNLGVITEEKIIRCEAMSGGPHNLALVATLETKNYLYAYKTKFNIGDHVILRGFEKAKRYNCSHEISDIITSVNGEDQLVLLTPFYIDDTGYVRQIKEQLFCEDISFHWNVAKVLKQIFKDAGYTVSSLFTEGYYFKNKYVLAPFFQHSKDWCEANSGVIGLSGANVNAARSIEPAWNTLISGNSLNFDLVNHVLKANDYIHFKLKINIFYDVAYGSTPGTVKPYFLYKLAGSGTWYQHDDWIGKVIVQNVCTNLVNISQKIEQEVEIRMAPGDEMMINVQFSNFAGPDTITIYAEGSSIEIMAQPTITKNSTVIIKDVLPDWKQIDFIKALKHLFNLKFLTDDHKRIVYIEPRDSFYTANQVDWTDKIDFSQEIKLEELGSDQNKTTRLAYIVDGNDDYDKKYKEKKGYGWASESHTILNRFAQDGIKEIVNGLFAATQMDFCPYLGFVHSTIPKLWKELKDDQTIPEKFTNFIPRILSLYPTKNCLSGDTWTLETEAQTAYPYFYFYDGSIDDNLCFNDIPGIGHGMKGLLNKQYGNYFRTIDNSRKITAFLNLSPSDLQTFIALDDRGLDFKAKYILRLDNETVHCRLDSIVEYRPGINIPTKCVLITDSDLPSIQSLSEIYEITFYNNINSIKAGDSYANGAIQCFGRDWYLVRAAAQGNVLGGDSASKYGIGSRDEMLNADIMYFIERGFLYFDTSILPDTCNILEATLYIGKETGSYEMEIAVFAGTQGSKLSLADYNNFGTVQFGESTPGMLGGRWITLNPAGLANINKTGWTKFALREKHFDLVNIPPTNNYLPFRTMFSGAPDGHKIWLNVKYKL